MNTVKRFLSVSIVVILLLTGIMVVQGAVTYNNDVNISTPTVWQDDTYYLNGNLTITSSLVMDNIVLVMGVNGSWILAQPGSTLHIKDCYFTTANESIRYSIFVEDNVDFTMENSTVENFGSKDPERLKTATYPSNEYEEYSRYSYVLEAYTCKVGVSGNDGLEVKSPAYKFANNSFNNYTHIRLFAQDNVVENNTFQNMSHEGLAFMKYTNNSIVRYNTFKNALRMDREIFGLRFYPSSQNHEIHHNHFEWLPWSMMMGNIPAYESGAPSWWGGQYYNIHHNNFRKVLMAMDMNVHYSHLHHNNVSNIYSRAITIAGRGHTIENNTMTNLDFQGEVDNIIGMDHFWAAWARENHCGIPNIAFWMFGFYCTRYFIRLAGRFTDSEVKFNYMANSPPYSFGIDMDADRKLRVDIVNNTFENIETYFPPDFTVRQDYTGHVALANVHPLSGAGIILENSDYMTIKGNIFNDVLHGITTTAPDGLGNAGNFTIENNYFKGRKTLHWNEDRKQGNYWTGNFSVIKPGVGIGTGLDWFTTQGIEVQPEYWGDSVQTIRNNTIYTYKYPVIFDYERRNEPNVVDPMGMKTGYYYDNLILNYDQIIEIEDGINTINNHSNILRPECPGPFKVLNEGSHLVKVYVDNYFMPQESKIDNFHNTTVLEWDNVGFTDLDLSIDLSTDTGASWQPLPGNKSLRGVNSSSQSIWLNVTTTVPISTDPSVYHPSNITLTYDKNTVPHITPLEDFIALKNQMTDIEVIVVDQDLDPITYQWEYLNGPVAGLVLFNSTTNKTSFVPNSSGEYDLRVRAGDGYVTASAQVRVTVGNTGPAALIIAPKAVFKGDTIFLDSDCTDLNSDILTYNWHLISGPQVNITDNTTTSPYLVPELAGTYTIGLRVHDGEEWSSTAEAVIQVYSRPPTANLTVPEYELTVGEGASFSANGSSDPDGVVSFYYFDFGDATSSDWTSQAWTTHFFYNPGNYTVTLKVRDEDYNVSEGVSKKITVNPVRFAPTASFTITPVEKLAGTELTFKSTSEDEDGYITSWSWIMGDGTVSIGETVLHTYSEPGEYNITLIVIDDHGLNSSVTQAIIVTDEVLYPPEITAHSPEVDPTIYLGESQKFSITIYQKEPSPLTITWTVDDDVQDDSGTSFEYEPNALGSYKVNVSVSDGIFEPVTRSWTLLVVDEEVEKPTRDELWNEYRNDTTDTDGDGLPDWWELYEGLDPADGTDATPEMKEKFEEEKKHYTKETKDEESSDQWIFILILVIVIIILVLICIGALLFLKGRKKPEPVPEAGSPQDTPETADPVEQQVTETPEAVSPSLQVQPEQQEPTTEQEQPMSPQEDFEPQADFDEEEDMFAEEEVFVEESRVIEGTEDNENELLSDDDLDDLDGLDDMFEL